MTDVFQYMSANHLHRTILLRDCMSPVTGFTDVQDEFFARSEAAGVRVISSIEALRLLN
jgi:hypothetical protein